MKQVAHAATYASLTIEMFEGTEDGLVVFWNEVSIKYDTAKATMERTILSRSPRTVHKPYALDRYNMLRKEYGI